MLDNRIQESLSRCKNKLLLLAQASVSESQFQALRKLILDELGHNGLESDLEKILADSQRQQERNGQGRNTKGNKGGVS